MIGFVVVNRDVLIARELERGGRYAPGLDFIRWRYEQLKREIWDDAEFWGISHRDIALARAEQIAAARSGNAEGDSGRHLAIVETIGDAESQSRSEFRVIST